MVSIVPWSIFHPSKGARVMRWFGSALVVGLMSFAMDASGENSPKAFDVYVGTYTGRGSEGIYHFLLDMEKGTLTPVGVTKGIVNPSFLALHPSGKFLYAVSEVETMNGKKSGGLSAFAIEGKDRTLELLNQEATGGGVPCHVSVDHTGKMAMIANYGGGSVGAFPLAADGKLMPLSSFIQHEGKGPNPARQEGPHAHSIFPDPTNRYAMAADLGLDKVFVYKIDTATGKLTPNNPPFASVPAGGGPRHFAFHPNGKFAYTNNELSSAVTAFTYADTEGVLTPIQTITTLPEGYDGKDNTTAEVQVHPSGKFVYVSNLGHDSIAGYSIDQKTGKLTSLGQTKTGGKVPRNFGIDPTGTYLLAANQDSNDIFVFKIDPKTGELTPTGS
ncbi:lactonase family protein, partial [bacterium]|nr:lactonase family protein [bacterium]